MVLPENAPASPCPALHARQVRIGVKAPTYNNPVTSEARDPLSDAAAVTASLRQVRRNSFNNRSLAIARDDLRALAPSGHLLYNSTTSCSCAAIGMLVLCGRSSIRPLNDSLSTASQDSGAPRHDSSIELAIAVISRDF